MNKLLTIGITTHNSHLFVSELLFNIKQNLEFNPQLFDDIEVLIYDDNSNEDTLKVLKSYEHLFNITYNKKLNGTPAIGRNEMIRNSKSKYILFMDGDDNFICTLKELVEEVE